MDGDKCGRVVIDLKLEMLNIMYKDLAVLSLKWSHIV